MIEYSRCCCCCCGCSSDNLPSIVFLLPSLVAIMKLPMKSPTKPSRSIYRDRESDLPPPIAAAAIAFYIPLINHIPCSLPPFSHWCFFSRQTTQTTFRRSSIPRKRHRPRPRPRRLVNRKPPRNPLPIPS